MNYIKWSVVLPGIAATALLFVWALHQNRYALYEAALRYEQGKSSLAEKRLRLNQWEIAYLENPHQPGAEIILLLHGFGASKENWLRFVRPLVAQYHVVAIDLPGHGESTKNPESDYRIEQQVENVRAIAKALKLDHFHIVGNSMGGAIASLYAAAYPEEIRSVVLIDPAGVRDHVSEFHAGLPQGRNPLIVETPGDFGALMSLVMKNPILVPWPVSAVAAELAAENRHVNHKIFADIERLDDRAFKNRLRMIKAPALIAWGSEDRVCHPGNAPVFNKLIPQSKVHLFSGVGHVPMIEIPEQSASVVSAFLSRLRREEISDAK